MRYGAGALNSTVVAGAYQLTSPHFDSKLNLQFIFIQP